VDRKVGKKIIWLYLKGLTHQMNFFFMSCLVKEKINYEVSADFFENNY
jgi:hypothetical protein